VHTLAENHRRKHETRDAARRWLKPAARLLRISLRSQRRLLLAHDLDAVRGLPISIERMFVSWPQTATGGFASSGGARLTTIVMRNRSAFPASQGLCLHHSHPGWCRGMNDDRTHHNTRCEHLSTYGDLPSRGAGISGEMTQFFSKSRFHGTPPSAGRWPGCRHPSATATSAARFSLSEA